MNSKPPFDIDGALSEILQAFAKRVEQVPRAATYGWSSEQSAVKSLIASVLDEVTPKDIERTKGQKKVTLTAVGYNAAIKSMRAKRKEMGL